MAHPRDQLKSLNANARKSLSQNFLTSPHWAENLARKAAEAPGAETVWEIGPGLGALTTPLLKLTTLPVTLFEYDRKLAEHLRATFPSVRLIEGDVLKSDFSTLDPDTNRISLLSNLPYHLSSPILFKVLESKERFVRAVFTFQKEFADRLAAEPRTHEYGALTVLIQLHFRVENMGVIPPGAFYPPPDIDSKALSLEPIDVDIAHAELSRVVKTAFAHRRKKISSNLRAAFDKSIVDNALADLGIAPLARPEELTKQDYLGLTKRLVSSK